MRLYTRCNSCKKDIRVQSNASTRPDLQVDKGSEFYVTCQNCGKAQKKHVNDIKAEKNNIIIIIGIILGLAVSVLLFIYFGIIGTLGIAIALLFWNYEMSEVKSFNGYMVRRK